MTTNCVLEALDKLRQTAGEPESPEDVVLAASLKTVVLTVPDNFEAFYADLDSALKAKDIGLALRDGGSLTDLPKCFATLLLAIGADEAIYITDLRRAKQLVDSN